MTALADPFDARLALRASGLLGDFNAAGVLTAADVHVASTLGRLCGEPDERVLLAAALAVRAVREGSVCLDLPGVRASVGDVEDPGDLDALPWPEPAAWLTVVEASALVAVGTDGPADRPVRLVDGLLYLDRYWREERLVAAELESRAARTAPAVNRTRLASALDRYFDGDAPDHQRLAVAAAATGWVTVVAGGPGTGKTTTVARLLAVLDATLETPPRAALTAPTGKAAARLQEAVADELASLDGRGDPVPASPGASTLHRLLGWRPDSHSRFRHHRDNHLPYDVVVVDETSMVSLTLMSRLLEAVRPDARLVLVGDPDQLASVEAGAILGDLVHRPSRPTADAREALLSDLVPQDVVPPDEVRTELRNDVVRLRSVYRYRGAIAALAEAVRRGDPDAVMAVLRSGGSDDNSDKSDALAVTLVEPVAVEARTPVGLEKLRRDVVEAGRRMVTAAREGDADGALAALERHRLLCAHRQGPYGVARWAADVERWVAASVDGYATDGEWYLGRPLIVTGNDYELGLYNGDTGVVVDRPETGPVAVFTRGPDLVEVAPSRLGAVQTVHAMTVHRAQGSQFIRVTVLLPPPDSPLLTRELLYTAVTRARESVRVVGSEASVRAAVERPVVRASGLRGRGPRPAQSAS
ncbi:MAG TPA: exodeoxyribonuclease V subunit alpha [Jiangellales bacterium]|nr:exodeoxyribonuclease V subunit alpha [Jiangellales bacterium]